MRTSRACLLSAALLVYAGFASAYDGEVEKKVFELASYTTVGGAAIPNVRVGWESYGKLNADRSNAILITHFFSGNSHAAGKYKPSDAAPGYWDAIIGAGKPIDTDKYFVLSSDTLVNLNTKDPNTTTTGPATINPATGKPWGMAFPIVTIRDFVNVQKALVESLGIRKLHAVIGASMGSLQAMEWGVAYPDMVDRVVPVIGTAEVNAFTIGWLDVWAAPIRLDPRWNKGDYYGKDEPIDGLALALKTVTIHAGHFGWADAAFGRKWAAADRDPVKSWDNQFMIVDVLDKAGQARAKASDANSFLYLVRANQLFTAGHGNSLEQSLAAIKAKVLFVPAESDLIFPPGDSTRAVDMLRRAGKSASAVTITGNRGHLDGVVGIGRVGEPIRQFLGQ
ncbi:MAG: homoserine O-acetyltransferase [Alphaproteobacteria bacterium]|nr:homoserine O-acetyltransferase [Alphaproteobacteria bacterium]